tara:strand:+ start:466 stop:642 length:177 start_codon:yes stop_codon:yes gene_type:complete
MKMQIGTEVQKAAILKKEEQMKALLTKHELAAGHMPHLMLLNEIVKGLEEELEIYEEE